MKNRRKERGIRKIVYCKKLMTPSIQHNFFSLLVSTTGFRFPLLYREIELVINLVLRVSGAGERRTWETKNELGLLQRLAYNVR